MALPSREPTPLWRYHLRLLPLHGETPPLETTWLSLSPKDAPESLRRACRYLDNIEKQLATGVGAGLQLRPFQTVILYLLKDYGFDIPSDLYPGFPRLISQPKDADYKSAAAIIARYRLLDAYLCSTGCLQPSTTFRLKKDRWRNDFPPTVFRHFEPVFKDWAEWARLSAIGLESTFRRRSVEGAGKTAEERVAACVGLYTQSDSTAHGSQIVSNLMAACASSIYLFCEELETTDESIKKAVDDRLYPTAVLEQGGSPQDFSISGGMAIEPGSGSQNVRVRTNHFSEGMALAQKDLQEDTFTVLPRALEFAVIFSPLVALTSTFISKIQSKTSNAVKAGISLGTSCPPDARQLDIGIQTFIVEVAFGLKPLEGCWKGLGTSMAIAANSETSQSQRLYYMPAAPVPRVKPARSMSRIAARVMAPPNSQQLREGSVVPYLMDEDEIPQEKRQRHNGSVDEDDDETTEETRPAKRPRLDSLPSRHDEGVMDVDMHPSEQNSAQRTLALGIAARDKDSHVRDDEDMPIDVVTDPEEGMRARNGWKGDKPPPRSDEIEEPCAEGGEEHHTNKGTAKPRVTGRKDDQTPSVEEEEEEEEEAQSAAASEERPNEPEEEGPQRLEEEGARRPEEEEPRRPEEEEAGRPEEEESRRPEEEEESRRPEEEEPRRLQEEEESRRLQEESRRLQEGEARRIEEEKAKRLQEEEESRRLQEEARRLQEEARRIEEEQGRLTRTEALRLRSTRGSLDKEHRRCEDGECPICEGGLSETEGVNGQDKVDTRRNDKEYSVPSTDDDEEPDECGDEACPLCKETLVLDDGDHGRRFSSTAPKALEPIHGIDDVHIPLADDVSDTETTSGTRRIVPGRFRRSHVDEWTTTRWDKTVNVQTWLQGLQGKEAFSSSTHISQTRRPAGLTNTFADLTTPLNLKAWKATGLPVKLNPVAYYKKDMKIIKDYIEGLNKTYVNGLPRHIAGAIDLPSSIKPVSFVAWKAMSFTEHNNLVRCFHVLIYDCPHIRGGDFDERTLGQYAYLDRETTMTDFSLGPNGNRQISADMYTVLSQRQINESPRILNAIGTLLNPTTEFESYNVCDAAFEATQGSVGPGPSPSKPSGKDWLLASNSWAYHGPHVDEGGGGTVVDTLAGGKLWMVLAPKWPNEGKNDPVSPKPEDYWKVFGQKTVWEAVAKGDSVIGKLQNCHWEGVLLPPQSRLLMRANTVHRVVTVDHSILKGGHFFNRGTLMETLLNNIVCLLGGKVFTNTEHPGMRIYIHRIILLHYDHYCLGIPHRQFQHHLLDPEKAEDMVQLQALLMLGILEDVFNPRSYAIGRANRQRRRKGEAPVGREPARAIYASYIKGISWTIVQWLTSRYTFSTAGMHGRTPWTLTIQRFKEDWWYDIVGRQLAIIETWRTRLVKQGIQGPVHDNTKEEIAENTKTLAEQVALVVEHHPSIDEAYQKCLRAPGECISPLVEFSWGSRTWKTTKVQEPFEVREGWQIVRLGTNSSDMQVFQAAGDGPFVLPPYADD
ncbi:hypothetical protein BKA70DRAFT_1430542 [Coprinopsis sp. MPI-PUGE-AT-0042]|nr:hypothetical protein BKA70DRAFT_1430542 [Coprinopsis sp. MPI-PUGE-AT-0042]